MERENQLLGDEIAHGLKTVSYVANAKGKQELVSGSIWQPVNIVNRQAWLEIEKQIEISKGKIRAGRVSCLYYYMTANQMDSSLLAQYTRQSRWVVRLHIVPFFFKRLGLKTLKKYADIFKVAPDDLIQGKLKPPVYQEHESQFSD